MKRFYDAGFLAEKWIHDYCCGNWKRCVRYDMEESGRFHPDNMLPDGSIDRDLR
ncbi:MAG: uracil-DNA glycosylase [Candidatus Marinimicrobia bacterium]|nr:uracil-DNA glycosylase [Candidatus Neomarinimicrobiota bacterium]